eukprot:620678-Rhodomonas_salina.3
MKLKQKEKEAALQVPPFLPSSLPPFLPPFLPPSRSLARSLSLSLSLSLALWLALFRELSLYPYARFSHGRCPVIIRPDRAVPCAVLTQSRLCGARYSHGYAISEVMVLRVLRSGMVLPGESRRGDGRGRQRVANPPIDLRLCYAMSGTKIRHVRQPTHAIGDVRY